MGGGSNSSARTLTSTRSYQSLEFTLTAKSAYARGEAVPFTFTVTNTGTATVAATIASGGPFSAVVLQGDTLVFSFGNAGGQAIYKYEFVPGETRSKTFTWDQKDSERKQVPPGKYKLRAFVYSGILDDVQVPENSLSSEPVEVTIR